VEGWEVWLNKIMVWIAWVALRKWQRAWERQTENTTLAEEELVRSDARRR
jgi:hypothetical protein